MAPLTLADLNRATLSRQLLLERSGLGVVEAVERIGGLQAQEPRPPHLALYARLEDPGGLNAALHDRALIRATLMRATLHTVTRAQFLAWRGALDAVLRAAMVAPLKGRDEGLDPEAAVAAARELLAEGPATFGTLRDGLVARFPGVNDRALGYCVRMCLPLAMVPTEDRWGFPRDSTFTPADAWLGTAPAPADPAALVRGHLAAFGPATTADVARWTGLRGLAAVARDLRDELDVLSDEDGRELLDLPGAPRPGGDADAPVRLLPEFDSLVLAHEDRRRVLPDRHAARLTTKNLRVRATYLVDGMVAGSWSLAVTRGIATVTLEPWERLRRKRELVAEAERLAHLAEPGAKGVAVSVASP